MLGEMAENTEVEMRERRDGLPRVMCSNGGQAWLAEASLPDLGPRLRQRASPRTRQARGGLSPSLPSHPVGRTESLCGTSRCPRIGVGALLAGSAGNNWVRKGGSRL